MYVATAKLDSSLRHPPHTNAYSRAFFRGGATPESNQGGAKATRGQTRYHESLDPVH